MSSRDLRGELDRQVAELTMVPLVLSGMEPIDEPARCIVHFGRREGLKDQCIFLSMWDNLVTFSSRHDQTVEAYKAEEATR